MESSCESNGYRLHQRHLSLGAVRPWPSDSKVARGLCPSILFPIKRIEEERRGEEDIVWGHNISTSQHNGLAKYREKKEEGRRDAHDRSRQLPNQG